MAQWLLSFRIRCYLITHAHLDHVNRWVVLHQMSMYMLMKWNKYSLVISAGSLKGPRKRVYAAKETLNDLESIFADRLWPNLASWKEEDEAFKLLYTMYSLLTPPLELADRFPSSLTPDNLYKTVFPDVSLRMVPVNHGTNGAGEYESAAFFIRHDSSGNEFLFFGDVEPDSVAQTPRNIEVWRIAAPKIPSKLSAVFIECSWPSGRPDELLYGHLTPEHLAVELEVLAAEVLKSRRGTQQDSSPRSPPARKKRKKSTTPPLNLRGALDGLRIYVMHCKDTMDSAPDQPMNRVIAGQVRALVAEKGLGAEVLAAEQGMRIGMSSFLPFPESCSA
jgi:cAMP phosphodiesterase